MSQTIFEGTSTGRCVRTAVTRGRMSCPLPLTDKQSRLLASVVDDKLTLGGRTFTRADLLRAFRGEQVPKDRAMCALLDIGYGQLEQRLLASCMEAAETPDAQPGRAR